MPATIPHAFAAAVNRDPHAPAIYIGSRRVTYQELASSAQAVASALRVAEIGRGDRVGVCLDRQSWLVPALLGVMWSGAAYVPLDPRLPAARIEQMSVGLSHVVTSAAYASTPWGAPVLLVEQLTVDSPGSPVEPAPVGADLAYVMYTSGSTGQPKAVAVSQSNVVSFLDWAIAKCAEPGLCFLAGVTINFDASILELFIPLLSGGSIVLVADPFEWPLSPARDQITNVFGAPSVLATMLETCGLPPAVRTVHSGGEALSRPLADRIHAQAGIDRLINWYGPTETTVACLAADVPAHEELPPELGAPVGGAEVSLRDEAGRVVPDGARGEIWVSGPGVAVGYLGSPELTLQSFVMADGRRWYRTGDMARRSIDGRYTYLGRDDDQVKIDGVRIELGEVTAALERHPDVRRATTFTIAAPGDGHALVSYVETSAPSVTQDALQEHARQHLPPVMVPSRIVPLERLPLTNGGKVDRIALASAEEARLADSRAHVPLESDVERYVADLWSQMLRVSVIGRQDNFMALGGGSLAAIRLTGRLHEELGIALPATAVQQAPRLADFARLVEEALLA